MRALTNIALLFVLSITDSLFSGYRAGAGRNPLLHKVDYTLRSFWAGLSWGLCGASGMALIALAAVYFQSDAGRHWQTTLASLDAAALPLVKCYGAFAAVLLLVLLLWTYPRRQTRELSTVLILGPCTLVRPFWIAGGAAWASVQAEIWQAALIASSAATQLGVEWVMNRRQLRAQLLRLQELGIESASVRLQPLAGGTRATQDNGMNPR